MTPVSFAELDWDKQGQPFAAAFGDVYFAREQGLAETEHVFIESNDLRARWRALPPGAAPASRFTIAETGFGTGLNFLATVHHWRQCAPKDAQLHYVSIEKYPMTPADLKRALTLWPSLDALAAPLLKQYNPARMGFYRLHTHPGVTLTLVLDEAVAGLDALAAYTGSVLSEQTPQWGPYAHPVMGVNAWFLDGFAPAKNPGMWTEALFKGVARLSAQGATFATFTAAGEVRRGLSEAGFEVKKIKGFGRKRDMLRGQLPPSGLEAQPPDLHPPPTRSASGPRARPQCPSWHLQHALSPPPETIAIVGAGLAGAHTANRLANKGVKVTVIDAAGVASGASGNAQGALYAKLSAQQGPLGEFNLLAYEYAESFYSDRGHFEHQGQACGLLQLAENAEQEAQLRTIAASHSHIVRAVSAEQASDIAGIRLQQAGLHFPKGGWLRPTELCAALLRHPNITLITNTPIARCESSPEGWQLLDRHGRAIARARGLVLCCAQAVEGFEQCRGLPLKPIRGQVDTLAASAHSSKLRAVLCASGYIAPADVASHCVGATYALDNRDSTPCARDTEANLASLGRISAELGELDADTAMARVSFRCASADYLPVIGPVPERAPMRERFAKFRQNFKAVIDAPGLYHPGLFVNVGHGSRGLVYTPIAAEILVAMMLNEPLPVSRSLALQLHSARFLIRDLKRNR